MAVKRYAGDRYTCLSSDTKPIATDGSLLTETDTLISFLRVGGAWVTLTSVSVSTASGSSDGESTTTSATPINKLTMLFTPTFSGTYSINWTAELANSAANKPTYMEVLLDTTALSGTYTARATAADVYAPFTAFKHISLVGGTTYTFYINYYRGSSTAKIRNARMAIWKVT